MQTWYVATGSNADTGVILDVPVQDGEEYTDTDEIELIDDVNTSESDPKETVDSQVMLLFVLGIIIGVLLIGDRRFY